MERQVKIQGTIAACPKCGRQPKHYAVSRNGGLHFVECSPCLTRTPSFPTFQQAVEFWERHETQAIQFRERA